MRASTAAAVAVLALGGAALLFSGMAPAGLQQLDRRLDGSALPTTAVAPGSALPKKVETTPAKMPVAAPDGGASPTKVAAGVGPAEAPAAAHDGGAAPSEATAEAMPTKVPAVVPDGGAVPTKVALPTKVPAAPAGATAEPPAVQPVVSATGAVATAEAASMAAAEPSKAEVAAAEASPVGAAEAPAPPAARLRGAVGQDDEMAEAGAANVTVLASAGSGGGACLCVFDIDRTLTGKQGLAGGRCRGNRVHRGVYDNAYGGGDLTLSRLGISGVRSTACARCKIGVVSHGTAGGRAMKAIIRRVVGSPAGGWSYPRSIRSPLVLACGHKPPCVRGVMDWYNRRGAGISPRDVYLFDDKRSNIQAFRGGPFNARQISCAAPDGGIGLCGASPGEIRLQRGVFTC